MDEEEYQYLHHKPYERSRGNRPLFLDHYTAMNLIQTMDVIPGGRVLEVGSGPGWLSEILMMLGFEVDAVEPSEKMIEIAEARLSGALNHYRVADPPSVTFHCITLEEAEFDDDVFDGILFFDSLHHIVNENKAIEKSYRYLREGGVLGISEGAWIPGDIDQANTLDDEMRRFGTLENPLTKEYLDFLLVQAGFVRITRYHSINGFFPLDQQQRSIASAAQLPAANTNNLTAIKPPSVAGPTTRDCRALTRAEITILKETWDDESGNVSLTARFVNLGETTWLQQQPRSGGVTIALRSGAPGSDSYLEAIQRHQFPKTVSPDDQVTVDLAYNVPVGSKGKVWHLDLVNEGLFWFSERGSKAATVGLCIRNLD
jgi:SAM-dependent methyltransferase